MQSTERYDNIMKNIIKTFKNEEEKKQFVLECEADFEKQLIDACERLANEKDIRIITLSGPTCSGKTTTAQKIIEDFSKLGKKVKVISIDDFYKERSGSRHTRPTDEEIDFESVDAIDLKYLSECAESLFQGKKTLLPTYDFVTQSRVKYEEFTLSNDGLVIFEGIQAIYPEVVALFSHHPYKSVYISVKNDICFNGSCFTKREIRLVRRIVRDFYFRNATPEFTFYLWKGVSENEEKNIFPYEKNAEIQLDSGLDYELALIKPHLIKILSTVEKSSEYYPLAKSLIEKFDVIPEISDKYLPKNSVYREFLG